MTSSDDEHFNLFRNVYRDHMANAVAMGRQQLMFEQLRGSPVADPKRLEQLVTALVRLRQAGELDNNQVAVGLGPVTYATAPQIAWMGWLGTYAIVQFNPETFPANARTVASLIYYQVAIVLAGGGSMNLTAQYDQLRHVVRIVLDGNETLHVHATHAGSRGEPVPGQPNVAALRVGELNADERDRFLRAYEKAQADAEHYTMIERRAKG